MEDKQIEAIINWLKPKSVQDIQVFIDSAKFYRRFIRGFSRVAALLTSMLKTTGSSGLSAPKAFKADNDEVVGGGSRADETVVDLSKSKGLKNIKIVKDLKFGGTKPPKLRC